MMGSARCRASRTVSAAVLELKGLVIRATTPPDPCLECNMRAVYNEGNLTPSISRILALDLGKKRIGLALSDPLRITAQGLPNLVRTNIRADLEALGEIVRERAVGLILMGNPINMRGTEGRQSGRVRELARS